MRYAMLIYETEAGVKGSTEVLSIAACHLDHLGPHWR